MSPTSRTRLLLGIDTGGTYTDAVVYDEVAGAVVAKAKTPTTHDDLALGIVAAVDRVLAESITPTAIEMVALSTTLATNALVEGRRRAVGAVFVGFDPDVVERGGLAAARADDPFVVIGGGHDAYGREREALDLAALDVWLESVRGRIEAVAVTARFGVREPAHEIAAAEAVRRELGVPVTCSHELADRLDGPRRAVTAVLNARLIAVVAELVDRARAALLDRGIGAPLMIVRGDGSLVSSEFARLRPIETVMSGPAASVVGAAHLTGLDDAVVSDIGGTTTDIAVLRGGRTVVRDDGAVVGSHRTMVRAVAMTTLGLGGDSLVEHDPQSEGLSVSLGPRRVVPLALAAAGDERIAPLLERQRQRSRPSDLDPLLITRTAHLGDAADATETRVMGATGDGPISAADVVTTDAERRALGRLVDRALLRLTGFTPTDAALVVGIIGHLDATASRLGAELFARRRDRLGRAVATGPVEAATAVIEELHRRSIDAVLAAALADDGIDPSAIDSPVVRAGLAGHRGTVRLGLGLAHPLVGLGAPASAFYPAVAAALGTDLAVPEHADVANAVGAVVGRVTLTRRCTITEPELGVYVVHHPDVGASVASLADARAAGQRVLEAQLGDEMVAAGAREFEIDVVWSERSANISGSILLVEGTLTATASGRPSL